MADNQIRNDFELARVGSSCQSLKVVYVANGWINLGLPRFRGQVDRSHAMTLRLSIDDQPNQDQAPVHASAEAGGY